ncbi:MAG: hypothetical protein HOC33_04970 [Alphaproteobacteria bacterium]|jgi:hypothetical protein|nr:hypothetical protein [Alphaproteobacteria bacterium]MBT4543179.1 hypothetical protein [Alphaproteobacteria bacterium]
MRWWNIISLVVSVIANTSAQASTETSTYALEDGIGYRSNLLDPANPYAIDSTYLLETLLRRYKLLPDEKSSDTRPSDSQYLDRVKKLLSSQKLKHEISAPFEGYHYAYGICATNDYPAALSFMEQIVVSLGKGEATDNLIMGRHNLLFTCELDGTERDKNIKAIKLRVAPKNFDKNFRPWVQYLLGTMHYYTSNLREAAQLFSGASSVARNKSSWLYDTSNYMLVRIAKFLMEEGKLPAESFENLIDKHQAEYSRSRYFDTVEGYRRLARVFANCNAEQAQFSWSRCQSSLHSDNTYLEILAAHFSKYFRPNLSVDTVSQRMSIYREMTFLGDFSNMSGSPLWLAYEMMRAVTGISGSNEVSTRDWSSEILKQGDQFDGFPGLRAYTKILELILNRDFKAIIELSISREDYGVLVSDAKLMQARSYYLLGKYNLAIKAWETLSLEEPTFNGLTEIANSYFKKGNFADFAYYRAGWMTDLSDRWNTSNSLGYHGDEFDFNPKTFFEATRPYLNLLRRGFEAFVEPKTARLIYADKSLPPIIRFLAAEPVMRDHLLVGEYRSFLMVWKEVFDSRFRMNMEPVHFVSDRRLIASYLSIKTSVTKLIENPDDAVAMTDLGYFLYEKHRFPRCFVSFDEYREGISSKVSLWEENLGGCKKISSRGVSPFDMFARALSIFKKEGKRQPSEARLLRIMIYCFKGNQLSCVRNSEADTSSVARRSWFRRLHKLYPRAAKRTPYWY